MSYVLILWCIGTLIADSSRTVISYNCPRLDPNSAWNTRGITYPYTRKDLRYPRSIFVDKNDDTYVSFTEKGMAIVWRRNNICSPKIFYEDPSLSLQDLLWNFLSSIYEAISDIVSALMPWDLSSGSWKRKYFSTPNSLFVAGNGDIYVGNDELQQIDIWKKSSATKDVIENREGSCFGLFLPTDNHLYCSVRDSNKIIKISLNNQNADWQIVTKNDFIGFGRCIEPCLDQPHGFFVDGELLLYIADSGNDRIQLWHSSTKKRYILIKSDVKFENKELSYPTSVILDEEKNLYIVDGGNHRIVFASHNRNVYRCLIACSGQRGSNADQLNHPIGISFDSSGNILVSDTQNDRVQKFFLLGNNSERIGDWKTCDEQNSLTTPTESSSSPAVSATGETNVTDRSTLSGSNSSSSSSVVRRPDYFPPTCPIRNYVGRFCNISTHPCLALGKPCGDFGVCMNNRTAPYGYQCYCHPNFTGVHCEYSRDPCQSRTCLNGGLCISLNDTDFYCNCTDNYHGVYCEHRSTDLCQGVRCLNGGICHSSGTNYTCRCISTAYSGRHCEHAPRMIKILRYVSRGFGYIGILSIASVMIFVLVMDLLKYGFGIDPVEHERELLRQEKAKRKRPQQPKVIFRPIYHP